MYFYFFCEFPAVIKFQGIIFGVVNNSVKFCDLSKPYPFTEICPLSGESENFNFYPDEEFLTSPPHNATITDLKGGYFLRFAKTDTAAEFKISEQAKFRDATITAFTDNGNKISLETRSGFYAETLAFSPVSVKFTRGEGVNSDLIFAFFDCGNKKILNVYGINEPSLLLSQKVDEFNVNPSGFTVKENIKDIAKHTISFNYSYDGTAIKETAREVASSQKFDREKLPERLIPYAFSEEFLCRGDFAFYLAENVKENIDKLNEYLGDFVGIMPPPIFRKHEEIGFIYKIAERRYSVDYFTFETFGGKITNIIKS